LIKEEDKSASFIVNGAWSKKAMAEASKYIAVKEVSNENGLTPSFEERKDKWDLENCAFVYLCSNETVQGLEFRDFEEDIALPSREELGGVPLVVDMGSDVLSKRVNWANIDVAFACCPKNFGLAGATVTFIRKNLIDIERKYDNFIPTFMRWKTLYDSGCMYNTLPVFNIYVSKKVLMWMISIGGIKEMERRAIAKSGFLYEAIDSSNGFYIAGQPKENKFRSRMNIPFTLKNESLNDKFLFEGFKQNIVGMKTKTPFGPGDIRVSLYNATEIEDARKLAAFMKEFAQTNQ
jgi:phosphoserine aminotransferase